MGWVERQLARERAPAELCRSITLGTRTLKMRVGHDASKQT